MTLLEIMTLEKQLDDARQAFLTERGWSFSSSNPGCQFLWMKDFGVFKFAVPADTAIHIEAFQMSLSSVTKNATVCTEQMYTEKPSGDGAGIPTKECPVCKKMMIRLLKSGTCRKCVGKALRMQDGLIQFDPSRYAKFKDRDTAH